jgi:AraC-like DNA-binding protein
MEGRKMSMIKEKKKDTLADRVVKFIISRTLEQLGTLTVEETARIFDVETAYLIEQFEKQKRITLKRYITREKIHRAFFKLEVNHSDSIESIANRLGFRRIAEFETEFQNYLFIPPRQFKELRNR